MKAINVLFAIIISFTFTFVHAQTDNSTPLKKKIVEPQVIAVFDSIFHRCELVSCKTSYFSRIDQPLPAKTYVKIMMLKVEKNSKIKSAYLESAPIGNCEASIKCNYVKVFYTDGTAKTYDVSSCNTKRNFDRILKNAKLDFDLMASINQLVY